MKKFLSLILAAIILLSPSLITFNAHAESRKWVTTWATSIVNGAVNVATLSLQDVIPAKSTLRIELQVTTGGSKLKFQFSNKFGVSDMTINEASVAKTKGEGKATIIDGTQVPIKFGGRDSVTIPAGGTVWSDEVAITTQALERLSVSMYFENLTYITSTGLSNARTFMGMRLLSVFNSGSQVNAERISTPTEVNIASGTITYHTTPFLAAINTLSSEPGACTAVFIGDSTLVNDTYLHYEEKLVNAGVKNISIVNQAIIGNKLLSDGTGLVGNLCGKALMDRFQTDVLSLSGVKYVFVKIGLNDICHQFSNSLKASTPKHSAQDIIAGYERLVSMAHSKGLKIYFFSKTPWKGYERAFLGQTGDLVWNMEMQKMCDELDAWIKSNNSADGYIDCSVLKNPADPYALCPSFTPDGAHLTNIASIALADLIPMNFVGVNAPNAKTAAQINNVDPYAEQKQIQYDLDHPTTAPEPATEESGTTAAAAPTQTTAPATTAPDVTVTTAPAPTAIENVTVPVVPEYTLPQEITTVPEYVTGGQNVPGGNVGVNYIVEDNVDSIGGNGSVIFILILFLVLIVAGTVIILTVGRKKDNEFG